MLLRLEHNQITIRNFYIIQPDILHRCLSAEHVLVSKDGVCKVTGFGFAEHVRDREEYESTNEVSLS